MKNYFFYTLLVVAVFGTVFYSSSDITGRQVTVSSVTPSPVTPEELETPQQILPAPKTSQPTTINPFQKPQLVSSVGNVPPQGYQPPTIESSAVMPAHLFDLYPVGFPGGSCGFFTQPKVADLEGDGTKEIISTYGSLDAACTGTTLPRGSTGAPPSLYVWNSQGNLKQGFPVIFPLINTPSTETFVSIVGIGDVVGDEKLEIIAATGRAPYFSPGGIYVISSTGQIITHILPSRSFSGIDISHAVLSDLDGDEKLEIIAVESDTHNLGIPASLYVWRGDGTNYPNWPVTLNGMEAYGEPAVVDFDEDGMKTIIITHNQFSRTYPSDITAYNPDATVKWTFMLPSNNFFPQRSSRPIIGDVDGDGQYEIVVKTLDYTSQITKHLILDNNGNLKYQWPTGEDWSYSHGVTLGDLNNNGKLEIIYHDANKIYVTDYRGNMLSGFPRHIWDGNPTQCNPTSSTCPYRDFQDVGLADIDDDGFLDIYGQAYYSFSTGQQGSYAYSFFAFDSQGNTLSGFPYHLRNYIAFPNSVASYVLKNTPTYADINNDGIADIITKKGWGRIEVFTLNTPYKKTLFPFTHAFSQYGFDEQNTKVVPKYMKYERIPSV